MSRLQNVSAQPTTQALSALIATLRRDAEPGAAKAETTPFTKAELRQLILEIMG
jgi:hypothetical protein